MKYITLIKTAVENPSGKTLITSVIEKEYETVEELIDILTIRNYVFAIHGKDHKIDLLTPIFKSDSDVFKFLSEKWHAFKCPLGDDFFGLAGVNFGTFLYECGYVDCYLDNPHRHQEEDLG